MASTKKLAKTTTLELHDLLNMDWANELTPLVHFLNEGHSSIVGLALREIGVILTSFYSMQTDKDA